MSVMKGDKLRVGSKVIVKGKVRTISKVHKWVRDTNTNQPIHRGVDFEECNNCGLTIWAHYDYEVV